MVGAGEVAVGAAVVPSQYIMVVIVGAKVGAAVCSAAQRVVVVVGAVGYCGEARAKAVKRKVKAYILYLFVVG